MTAVNLNHPHRRPQKPWTPELDRRSAVLRTGHNLVLGEFLDHLRERGIVLARYAGAGGCDLAEHYEREEKTVALFFGLDVDKIGREQGALLSYVRAVQAWHDDREERVRLAVAHYERTQTRGTDE
jgi:hypothetical protein